MLKSQIRFIVRTRVYMRDGGKTDANSAITHVHNISCQRAVFTAHVLWTCAKAYRVNWALVWSRPFLFIKTISIHDEQYVSETAVECIASYFVKIILWCRWCLTLPPYLRQCLVLLAVAKGLLLLDIGWLFLFSVMIFYITRNNNFMWKKTRIM